MDFSVTPPFTPFRACCGQQHLGPVCPDGLVMCQLCFGRFPIADLYEDEGGRWDVCRPCGETDSAAVGNEEDRGRFGDDQ